MRNTVIAFMLLILMGGISYFSYQRFAEEKLACAYPPFDGIENGMTAEDVTDALGEPDQKIVKDELGGNRFGQSERELLIMSGWLYDLPGWDGGLEVYFDSEQNVVGKNCGHG